MSTTNKTYLDLNGLTQYDEKIKEYIGYTEITYEDWLELTDEEKETGKWYVTGVPGADGTVSIDLMTKLWENPNPSVVFDAGTVQLSSTDFDIPLIIGRYDKNNPDNCPAVVGNVGYILFPDYGSSNVITRYRKYTISGNTVTFSNAYSNGAINNNFCIPYQIYGIKLHHTVEIKAIAPEVSTLASKCMMSDGTTSVEDAVDGLTDMLNEAAYSTNGLTFDSGVTYVSGGFCKIGNLIIVNMRVSLSASIQSFFIHGLPTSTSAGDTTIVSVTNNRGADIVITGGGDLGSVTTLAAGTLVLTTVYISD